MEQKSIFLAVLCIAGFSYALDFSCDDPVSAIVHYYGNNLTCPDNLFCNVHGVATGTAKPILCVPITSVCEYKCNPNNSSMVLINGITFTCDKKTECNAKQTSCEVCIEKECDKNAFKCIDDKTVEVNGFQLTCPANQICNKDYEKPCDPCIDEKKSIAPGTLNLGAKSILFSALRP